MITLWIARDKDNSLSLFVSKPINHADTCWIPRENVDCGNYIDLPESEFPEINWDNSPKQITLNVDC
jgi:hypothetical protein